MSAIRIWNIEVFGHCQSRINEIIGKIEKIQCEALSEENVAVEAKLQYELSLWLSRQKSCESWLKDGDWNSKCFHISTIVQRKKNVIDAIRGEDGEWLVKYSEIKDYLVGSF